MREKPRIPGQLPLHPTHVYCDELHEEKCTLKTGVDIHIFLIQSWRSVVLKNIKPEIDRPKTCNN